MAWDLDGSTQYARFTMSAALQAATGGPFTFGAVVNLDAVTDGALIHMLDGTAGRHFLEIFSTFNWGTASAAKTGPAGTGGGTTWVHIVMSKPTGTVPVEYTITVLGGAPTSGTAGGGNLANGAAPGAAGQIQIGRFALSATEYVDGRVAALWCHATYMNQATREGLNTWALVVPACQAGGLGWAVRLNTLSTIVDATGLGGDETGRFGTVPFTLVADPSGPFFDSTVFTDASGGSTGGGTPDGLVIERLFTDSSGGATSGGQVDAPTVGIVKTDTSGGSSSGGTADAATVGVVKTDASGGSSSGGDGDVPTVGMVFTDSSGGSSSGGQADAPGSAVVVTDTNGGSSSGGTADAATVGVELTSASGGATSGGTADTITGGASGTYTDTSGGATAGGSPDVLTGSSPTVKSDTMVMPILQQALDCLRTEASFTTPPPAHYHVRPGASFEPSADGYGADECCDGIGWVRLVANYEGGDANWVEPSGAIEGNCAPMAWAVVIEIGLMRCVPIAADRGGGNVTSDQWTAAAQAQMDDGAALRRVLCCLRDIRGVSYVVAGQLSPLENSGGCGGITLQVTIRADACDC